MQERELAGCSRGTGRLQRGDGLAGRLRDWTEAGVWPQLHEVLLTELPAAGLLDMDDAAIDGSHIRALKGLTPDLRRSTGPGPAASTT